MADRSTRPGTDYMDAGSGATLGDWANEEAWWRDNFRARPYVSADHDFDRYRRAYRHGFEGAHRYRDQGWGDVESDMRYGWEHAEDRTPDWSPWEEIKDAARDAWERVRGRR